MAQVDPRRLDEADAAPVEDEQDPLVGKVLNGRFTVLERLGSGGMGRVYKALQAPLDRLVALKILDTNYASGKDPGFQKRFFLEASLTSKLRHPNTITVIDYGKTPDGIFYIAMEYVEGITLAQLIVREGVLPWLRALHIAQQICRSLREAHKLGVIHRDLKPANVMLLNEETDHDLVKVLDFGLVKSFAVEDPNETELTQQGMLLGSPLYMAPEQAKSIADPRSDVYSLGVVLYQMLVGKPPFQGQSIDVIVKHINETPVAPSRARPDVGMPSEVEELVLRCLAKDPTARFQSMDELLEAIRNAGGLVSSSGVFARPGSHPGRSSSPPVVKARNPPGSGANALGRRPSSDRRQPGTLRRRAPLLVATVSALMLAVFLALIIQHQSQKASSPPAAKVERVVDAVPPRPKPAPVTPPRSVQVEVRSEPAGAQVLLGTERIGQTPFTLDVKADGEGTASTELTFRMDGYEPLTMTTRGTGPVIARLRKKATPPKPAPKTKTAPGYKDDPYE